MTWIIRYIVYAGTTVNKLWFDMDDLFCYAEALVNKLCSTWIRYLFTQALVNKLWFDMDHICGYTEAMVNNLCFDMDPVLFIPKLWLTSC